MSDSGRQKPKSTKDNAKTLVIATATGGAVSEIDIDKGKIGHFLLGYDKSLRGMRCKSDHVPAKLFQHRFQIFRKQSLVLDNENGHATRFVCSRRHADRSSLFALNRSGGFART
ncbi:MAG: hypothetical protein JSR79_00175 [Proteobacteria bacterium]|nr:hypothetical protein [Pseudomonadota bacterium]